MNQEQIKAQIRTWLVGLAGVILGWFANKGWITTEQITGILNSPVVAAIITMGAGAIWSAFVHSDKNAVAVVDAMAKDPASAVQAVITTATPEGRVLAASIPGNTTVSAGSVEASIASQ